LNAGAALAAAPAIVKRPTGPATTHARDKSADSRTVSYMRGLKLIAALSVLAEVVGAAAILWRPSSR